LVTPATLAAAFATDIAAVAPFYMLATLWTAVGAVICYGQTRPAAAWSLPDFIAFVFPTRILFHASARLDLWFMVVRWLARPILVVPFVFSVASTGEWLARHLAPVVDASELRPLSFPASIVLVVALIIATDFARFFAHYLAHRVPVLWTFHKVHHSAEVLIPPTALRLHPVDELCLFMAIATANTLVFGIFFAFYHLNTTDVTRLGLDAYIALYLLSFYPLRHSHLPLRFSGVLECLLMSPAMHQLHHSREPRHHGKNLGLALAVWDRLFGTFAAPEPDVGGALGLGGEERRAYGSVWALYMTPVAELSRRLIPSRHWRFRNLARQA
jgi:sterol desaturase/sphingolipid hydroxylase (fatty acid hydroxylase superfamily)